MCFDGVTPTGDAGGLVRRKGTQPHPNHRGHRICTERRHARGEFELQYDKVKNKCVVSTGRPTDPSDPSPQV